MPKAQNRHSQNSSVRKSPFYRPQLILDLKIRRRYILAMRPYPWHSIAPLSLACIFLLTACDACQSSHDITVTKNGPSKEVQKAIRDPIVFARLKGALVNTPMPDLSLGHCAKSNLFQTGDLCAPLPQKASDQPAKTGTEVTFLLAQPPVAFFWQQALNSHKVLTIEIIDSSGMPLPTTTASTRQLDLLTVEISPSAPLPQEETLYLRGTVFDENRIKKQTWLLPITIGNGLP